MGGASKNRPLQGFGDFRPDFGPLLRRHTVRKKGLELVLPVAEEEEVNDEAMRAAQLRQMAQELSRGLRAADAVKKHTWYSVQFKKTFTADDAVKWVAEKQQSELAEGERYARDRAVQVLQELLEYGFIRRVSKWERNSIGWEATEYVVKSKRRFKDTTHTLYRFDELLNVFQLHVTISRARDLGKLMLRPGPTSRLFARVRVGGKSYDTMVAKRDLHPNWNATFVFGFDEPVPDQTIISVSIYDGGTISGVAVFASVCLGSCDVALSTTALRRRWYPLQQGVKPLGLGSWALSPGSSKSPLRASPLPLPPLPKSPLPKSLLGRLPLIREDSGASVSSVSSPTETKSRPRPRPAEAPRKVARFELQAWTTKVGGETEPKKSAPRPCALAPVFAHRHKPAPDDDFIRGGLRHYRLIALIESCEDVRFDLSETWGLRWVMEVKIIVGSAVAVTRTVERDRIKRGAQWGERLTLDVYANRRVDDIKLVVCQRARRDFMTRHVGACRVPLASLQMISNGGDFPRPGDRELQRLKHGLARHEQNGRLKCSLWLLDIKPPERPPFALRDVLLADGLVLLLAWCFSWTLFTLSFVVTLGPISYLFRKSLRPSMFLGRGLTWALAAMAPLGVELSFGTLTVNAWVDTASKRGVDTVDDGSPATPWRLHVRVDVGNFLLGNPTASATPAWSTRPLRASNQFCMKQHAYELLHSADECLTQLVASSQSLLLACEALFARLHFAPRPSEAAAEAGARQGRTWTDSPPLTSQKPPWAESPPPPPPPPPARNASESIDSATSFTTRFGCAGAVSGASTPLVSPHHASSPDFAHHFLSAQHIRLEFSLGPATFWGAVRLLYTYLFGDADQLWCGSPEHMAKLRLQPSHETQLFGRVRIEELDVEGVNLHFCTSHHGHRKGEFNVNSFVRRIADTMAAAALYAVRPPSAWERLWAHFVRLWMPTCSSLAVANRRPAIELFGDNGTVAWPDTVEVDVVAANLTDQFMGDARSVLLPSPPRVAAAPPPGWDGAARQSMPQFSLDGSFDEPDAAAGSSKQTTFKVVVRLRALRRETFARPGATPQWRERFALPCDDASAVLHVQVYELRRSRAPRICGQWLQTIKYLATQPMYSANAGVWFEHDDDDDSGGCDDAEVPASRAQRCDDRKVGHVEDRLWVCVRARLCDAQWRPTANTLDLRLRWVADRGQGREGASGSLTGSLSGFAAAPYAKAIDQLRSNSDETRLRIGDTARVRYMLASFPFHFDIVAFKIRDVRLFVKDLFLGSEGEMARLRTAMQVPDGTMKKQLSVEEQLTALTIREIDLSNALATPAVHQGGFDLFDVLRLLTAKLSNEVLRSAPVMTALASLVPAFLANHSLFGVRLDSAQPDAQGDATKGAAAAASPREEAQDAADAVRGAAAATFGDDDGDDGDGDYAAAPDSRARWDSLRGTLRRTQSAAAAPTASRVPHDGLFGLRPAPAHDGLFATWRRPPSQKTPQTPPQTPPQTRRRPARDGGSPATLPRPRTPPRSPPCGRTPPSPQTRSLRRPPAGTRDAKARGEPQRGPP